MVGVMEGFTIDKKKLSEGKVGGGYSVGFIVNIIAMTIRPFGYYVGFIGNIIAMPQGHLAIKLASWYSLQTLSN